MVARPSDFGQENRPKIALNNPPSDPYSSGTLVKADGITKHLALKDLRIEILDRWKSPQSGGTYPMKWKVAIPSEEIELEITPAFPDQEVTYWEGAVRINGTIRNRPITGNGYVEMTGYVGKLTI